jgi:hypothetical protein
MSSHLWRAHAHYSPQLIELWTYVSSPLLSHTPTGQEQVLGTIGWGAWWMLRCVCERSRSSSPSQLWVARSLSPFDVIIYLFYTELLLYNKVVTFVSIPLFMICVRLGPSTPDVYVCARVSKTRVWHEPSGPSVRDPEHCARSRTVRPLASDRLRLYREHRHRFSTQWLTSRSASNRFFTFSPKLLSWEYQMRVIGDVLNTYS